MYFKWSILQLKRNIVSLTFWGVTAVLLIAFGICSYVEKRHSDDIDVLMCSENSELGDKVIKKLASDGVDGFVYHIVDDREEMEVLIAKGEATCGFVFTEDFDDAVREMKPDGEVLLLQAADSLDGLTIKEVIYPAILTVSSDVIVGNYLEEIEAEDEAKELVLTELDEILSTKSLKIFEYVNIEDKNGTVKEKGNSTPVTFLIMTSLLIASVFVAVIEDYKLNNSFFRALKKRKVMLLCMESAVIDFAMFLIPIFVMRLVQYLLT